MAGAMGNIPQMASLYVGDLHPDVTEAMLYEIFNSVGPVGSIRICRDSVSRRSLGYGYVNFHSVSDAERAIEALNYSNIKGRACRIMWIQRDPSLRKSGVGNVFVKNLHPSIDNKALYDTFSLFGNILSCKAASDSNGKSLGYGFVHYETEEAAKQAIERVNGMQIGERTVEVTLFLKRNDRDTKENFTNVYVKNVPANFDEQMLKDMFGKFGDITSNIIREDKIGRKFCFINYDTMEAARACMDEMHGKDLRTDAQKAAQKEDEDPENYLLYISRAQTKAERAREFNIKSKEGTGGRPLGVNLYIKNLDDETDNASLRDLFSSFGTITSAIAMKDDSGKCKGFGFVCFESPDEATKAVMEMHLKVVKGKPLYVGLAEKREARQERLRQRYSPGGGGMPGGGKGGKDGMGMGKGKGQGGKDMSGGTGAPQGMGGMGGGPMGQDCVGGGMGGGMQGGPGGGMAPQMMGMMGPKGAMMYSMPAMMGGKGSAMMGGKGGPMAQMMGNPQMMGMMGKGGPGNMPQMMGMLGGKGSPMGCMPGGPMGPMGPMRPMMPGMPGGMPLQMQQGAQPGAPQQNQGQQQPQQQQQQRQQPALTAAALAAVPPNVQKQMIGERLFPAVSAYQPALAGKITGMMLEMDNSELCLLLESEVQLKNKVDEAMRVLEGSRPSS